MILVAYRGHGTLSGFNITPSSPSGISQASTKTPEKTITADITNRKTKRPQAKNGMLLGRLANLGNFIKRIQDIIFHGT
jgi:hypothetical protein